MAARLALGMILGATVTLTLFWVMQYLIGSAEQRFDNSVRGNFVDFVRLKKDEIIERKQLKPRKPPIPEIPPSQPPTPKLDQPTPSAEKIAIVAVPVTTDIELTGGFSLGIGEGDYLPLVKVAPIYPRRAVSRGVEGHCIVEYTVTRAGTTKDARIISDGCTSGLFESVSLAAALKFKYKPRIIDGEPVEVSGVRNKFTYELEK
ncbi:MAG: protein TonB [Gammaproteobacteria bacterium]|jgi:protein TonB